MTYSKIPVARSVVALCISKGIKQVVISPGSRNAPLTIGFINHPDIHAYSIVDERCAAFFALGIAQQTQTPVALVCTSGSALLNYYPAIAEAYYSDIPLVVLSADRPVERIDIGDGQTIRQRNVFANHIVYSANLYSEMVPVQEVTDQKIKQKLQESQRHNEQEINKALNLAIEQQGPVHINIPFYEPLYDVVENVTVNPITISPKLIHNELSDDELMPYAQSWSTATRKMIIVGVCPPDLLDDTILNQLAQDPSVLVFTETTSNLHHPQFFTRIDNVIGALDDAGFKELQPEILLTFGGMVISKKIKAFLREYQPAQHWHIDTKKAYDTYFCLNRHFEVTPHYFFNRLFKLTTPVVSNYQSTWQKVRELRDKKHEAYVKEMPWCDFKAFAGILSDIPDHSVVHIGNSSAIRYAQLFDINKTLEVYCNRGTSGIDGSTSTAIGAAVIAAKPTVLLTGDLSFFYDSNALWNTYTPKNFKVILINNGGGGIFRILPNKEKDSEAFDAYFETTHDLNAQNLCAMYGWSYYKAQNENEYLAAAKQLYTLSTAPGLLEIVTPRKINDKVLLSYFDFIK